MLHIFSIWYGGPENVILDPNNQICCAENVILDKKTRFVAPKTCFWGKKRKNHEKKRPCEATPHVYDEFLYVFVNFPGFYQVPDDQQGVRKSFKWARTSETMN